MPAVTVTDAFTRADTAAGTLGSTSGGAVLAWQNVTNWNIATNQANNSVATKNPAWINNGAADATISINTTGGNGVGPAFWVQDTNNFWVAYLYSNRYTNSTTAYACPPCSETVYPATNASCSACGDCTTNAPVYAGNRVSNTGTTNSISCGNPTVGSCTGACGGCTSNLDNNLGSYVSARSGTCTTRTVQNRNCSGTNSCGNLNTATNSCGASCSTSAPVRTCGFTPGCTGTANCNTQCGYNSQTNRTCYCGCFTQTAAFQNASAGCSICNATNTGCASSETRREYIFRISRVAAGTETVVYSNTVLDTTSTNTSIIAAIKVITSGTNVQAIGYSDTAMTTIYHNSGSQASGYTDNTTAVGVGMVRMDLGTATPGLVYTFDDFSAAYVSGGDSVGIIQG